MYSYKPRKVRTETVTPVSLYDKLSRLSADGIEADRSYHEGVRKRRLERAALKAKLKRMGAPPYVEGMVTASPQVADGVMGFDDAHDINADALADEHDNTYSVSAEAPSVIGPAPDVVRR